MAAERRLDPVRRGARLVAVRAEVREEAAIVVAGYHRHGEPTTLRRRQRRDRVAVMPLADEYQALVDDQAADWSDLRFELTLADEAQFDTARLFMAPAQLQRMAGERDRFSFRVSRTQGYGAHAGLVSSCLTKLDERRIRGELELVRVLHGVRHNRTQGPSLGSRG